MSIRADRLTERVSRPVCDSVIAWLQRQRNPLLRLGASPLLSLTRGIQRSTFSRNVSVMLVGTVAGQMMSVALSPVLTRIYTPLAFSALAVYMSALSIIVGLASFRYEIPMSTASDDDAAVNLLALCSVLLCLTTASLAAAGAVLPAELLRGLGLGEIANIRLLLPLGFLLLGSYYVTMYFATREQDFTSIARTRISQGLSGPVSQIGLGLAGCGVTGLIVGFIIGQSSGALLLLRRTVLRRTERLRMITLRGVLRQARRHRAFPLISSWASLIDTAGAGQLVYILCALYYPGHIVGYMFLAERVVARPLLMVSTSLLTVFMGEVSRTIGNQPDLVRRRFLQVSSRQFAFGVTWVLIVDVGAKLFFPLIFGAVWAGAVPYLLLLSAVYLANSVIGSVAYTLQLLGQQSVAAMWQVGRVVMVILCFIASHHAGLAAKEAIAAYTAVQVFACLILYWLMRFYVDGLAVAPEPQA